MSAIQEVRIAHATDPIRIDGRPQRLLQGLSDSDLMARITGNGLDREDVKSACRELWYRIREMHAERMGPKWGIEALDGLDATFVEVLKTAKKFFAEEGLGLDRFTYRVWDRLTKQKHRGAKRRKEQTVEDWEPIVGKLREQSPVGNELEEQELRNALYEEIPNLEADHRKYLELRLGEGLIDAEIARRLNVNPSKVCRWGREVIAILRERLAKRGLAITATGLLFMLMDGPLAEAGEARLDRLIEAAPDIVAGNQLPAGSLSPAVEAILAGESVATTGTSPWFIAAGVALIGIPVSFGLGFWNPKGQPLPVVQEAAATVAAEQTQEATVSTSEPVEATKHKPLPGNFPEKPSTGQIHTIEIGSTGVTVDLVWGTSCWWFRTEVTQAQWKAVGLIVNGSDNPSAHQGDDLPVENFPPKVAKEFCLRFAEITGIPVRLPRSQEWEEAASAGLENPDDTPSAKELDLKAWYRDNSGLETHPVGGKDPNAWNLRDIYGNVFEILLNEAGALEIRGASWSYEDFWCVPNYPSKWSEDEASPGIGMRLVFAPDDVLAQ